MKFSKDFPLIAFLLIGSFLGVFIAVMFPLRASLGHRYKAICASHLKRMQEALTLYTQDYEGTLPVASFWMDKAKPYVSEPKIFGCPALKKESYGYAMNVNLSGKRLQDFPGQPVPMIYDSVNLARNATDPFTSLPDPPRHFGNNVCYPDGSVKTVLP